MHSFEQAQDVDLNWCDALIIGTPVYHAAPPWPVLEYFASIPPLPEPKPAFVYNTRGLYSCNTNRILAKKLAERKILTVMDRSYGAPASDGSLITTFIDRFFRFNPRLEEKIRKDCELFVRLLVQVERRTRLPRFHLSSILNAPNKLARQWITFPIYLHRERCRAAAADAWNAAPGRRWLGERTDIPRSMRHNARIAIGASTTARKWRCLRAGVGRQTRSCTDKYIELKIRSKMLRIFKFINLYITGFG